MGKPLCKFMPMALAALLAVISPAAAEPVKWDMPNEMSPASLGGLADTYFVEALKRRTDDLQIVLHLGGALGYAAKDQFAAVQDNAVPIAHTFGGALAGIDPIFLVNTLPFLVSSSEEMEALVKVARPYLDKVFEESNQKLLFVTPWTPVGIWAKKPVRTIEDLNGLVLRTYDVSGTVALKEAGVSAIQLSWADTIPALSTGTVNGVLTSDEGGIASRFWEHTDHFSQLNFTSGLDMTHVNLDAFNALSPELQTALVEAAAETEAENWKRQRARIIENVATMKANGVNVVEDVSPELLEFLRKASQPVVTDWFAKMGDDGTALIDAYNKEIGR